MRSGSRFRAATLLFLLGCSGGGGNEAPPIEAVLLFRSGFDADTRIETVDGEDVLAGTDLVTGFSWETDLPAESASFVYLVHSGPPEDFVTTSLVDGTLFQEVKADDPVDERLTRNQYMLRLAPNMTQAYVRYRMKLQEDYTEIWPASDEWRMVMEWMEPDQGTGDDGSTNYRFHLEILRYEGLPVWVLRGEIVYPVRTEDWTATNAVPVPIGRWFDLEVFWRYGDSSTGRVWAKVDGVVVADYQGRTRHPDNPLGIDRWHLFKNYSNIRLWAGPTRQWVDDVEIWSDAPGGHP